ncbi:MAG: hypothetical protein U5N85_05215 [Arcicella sp.]|nr:hypothetical protein [Arcicella sp.]
MSKTLILSNYQGSMIHPKPAETDVYLMQYGKRDLLRNPIKDCISRTKVFNRSNSSSGLFIKLKRGGKGFHFEKYNSAITLGVGEFALTSDTVNAMFSDISINSLIVYPCDNDIIVIEMATDRCNDGGGAGGDGVKVRVPA